MINKKIGGSRLFPTPCILPCLLTYFSNLIGLLTITGCNELKLGKFSWNPVKPSSGVEWSKRPT